MSDTETDTIEASAGEGATAATGLSDEHHDWASSFCGVDTRAGSGDSSGGGILGALSSAASAVGDGVSNVASSVAETAGSAVSTAADAAVSAGRDAVSGIASAVGTVASTAFQSAGRAVDSVEDAASGAGKALESGASLGSVADQMAQSVFEAGAGVAHDVVSAAPLPDALKGAANTAVDFGKGEAEGVFSGVEGMVTTATAAVNLASGADLVKGAAGLALSAAGVSAGDKMLSDVKGDIETNVGAAESMLKMSNPVGLAEMATQAVQGFEQASAQGHGVEYVGMGLGKLGVAVFAGVLGGEGAEAGELPPGDTPPPGGGEPAGSGGGGGGEQPGGGGGDPPPSSKGGGEPPPSSKGGGDDPSGDAPGQKGPKRSLKSEDPDHQLKSIKKAQNMSREILKRLKDLDRQIDEAYETGDTETVKKLEAERKKLQETRPIIDSTKKSENLSDPNRRFKGTRATDEGDDGDGDPAE